MLLFFHRVLRSSYYESYAIVGPFTSHSLFNSLLLTLQVLHVFWFYRILRMVYLYIIKGQVKFPFTLVQVTRPCRGCNSRTYKGHCLYINPYFCLAGSAIVNHLPYLSVLYPLFRESLFINPYLCFRSFCKASFSPACRSHGILRNQVTCCYT